MPQESERRLQEIADDAIWPRLILWRVKVARAILGEMQNVFVKPLAIRGRMVAPGFARQNCRLDLIEGIDANDGFLSVLADAKHGALSRTMVP